MNTTDLSKRRFLRTAAALAADTLLTRNLGIGGERKRRSPNRKVIIVIFGGVRRAESFSPDGLDNIPHLARDLMPQSLFYTHTRNDGITSHFNATSSIFTGTWQRVDDWGKLPPTAPTLFEYFRKQMRGAQEDVWVVASNKALTKVIGASAVSSYGPAFGANIVFPKQLLITAVMNAIWSGESQKMGDREKVQAQLEAMLMDSNYEGLGWSVFKESDRLEPDVRATMQEAITQFVHNERSTTGDELTFWMSREIMRRFAPTLLVVIYSDVEVAHFGSYSLHLAGISNADRLTYQLWEEAQKNGDYRGQTTMVVMPEFGRDPDGSTTNGFLNHRSNDDSCRMPWMMILGAAVDRPKMIEQPVAQIDLCPTLAGLLGCQADESQGRRLGELRV
jgi:hypothetical protein